MRDTKFNSLQGPRPIGYYGADRKNLPPEQMICITASSVITFILIFMSVLLRIHLLLAIALWLGIQTAAFNIPRLSPHTRIILSSTFTIFVAASYLSYFLLDRRDKPAPSNPPALLIQPPRRGDWVVYSQPCGNPVRCCAKEMKEVHGCMWNKGDVSCAGAPIAYWSCLVGHGMPLDEHNVFVHGRHGRYDNGRPFV